MQTDDMPAIPLWINGHAYLTLAPAFLDVRNPASGEILRRTPLCDASAALQAVAAAQAAVAAWAAQSAAARAALLAALGQSLAAYAAHFVRLIGEESGKEALLAATEVADAVALLGSPPVGGASGVVAVVGNGEAPLLSSLRLAVPALTAGAALVIRPAPQAPSAIFALAELSARCGFPGGVLNVLQGGDDAVEGLRGTGVRLFRA